MIGFTLSTLLDANGLSADGNVETRRRRLKQFIGISQY